MNDALLVPHHDFEEDEEDTCHDLEFNLVFVKSSKKGVQIKRLYGPGKLHDGPNRKLEQCLSEHIIAEANSPQDLVPYDEDDDDLQTTPSQIQSHCALEDPQTEEINVVDSVTKAPESSAHINNIQDGKVPEDSPSETLNVSLENCDVLQQHLIELLDHFKGDTRNTVLRYLADVIEPSNGTRKSFTKGEKKSNDVLWLWDEDRLGPPPAGTNIRSRLRKENAWAFSSFLLLLPMLDPARHHRLREILGARKSPPMSAGSVHWIKDLRDLVKDRKPDWKFNYNRKNGGIRGQEGDNTSPEEKKAFTTLFEKVLVLAQTSEMVALNEEDPTSVTVPVPEVLKKRTSVNAKKTRQDPTTRTSRRKGSDSGYQQSPFKKKRTKQQLHQTKHDIAPKTKHGGACEDVKMKDRPYDQGPPARRGQEHGSVGQAFDQRRPHQPPPVSTINPGVDTEMILSYPPSANTSFSALNEPPNAPCYQGMLNSGHPDHAAHFYSTATNSPIHNGYPYMRSVLPAHVPYGYNGNIPATPAAQAQGLNYAMPDADSFSGHQRCIEDGWPFYAENLPQYDHHHQPGCSQQAYEWGEVRVAMAQDDLYIDASAFTCMAMGSVE
ncbi:MAG: hypothetical protein M1831_002013 [Alyxoria varia]|nr:MAG: hypothetical protein M1831_002013 [Alyxoria varia]